jgi:hypothetical protein
MYMRQMLTVTLILNINVTLVDIFGELKCLSKTKLMSEQQTTLGEPMWVESLMTPQEWQQRMIRYPTTSNVFYTRVNKGKTNPFKWRYSMGYTLSSTEISNINANLDYLRKRVKV